MSRPVRIEFPNALYRVLAINGASVFVTKAAWLWRRARIPYLLHGLACVAVASSAYAAEDWLTISTNSPNISFSIDKSSVERTGESVQFWEKMIFSKPEVEDEGSGKMIKEKRVQRLMHCQDRTQAVIYGSIYGEDGSFITSTSFEAVQRAMVAIPPGTVAEQEFRLVCAKPSGTFFGINF
jgi:hypothetical protein